MSRICQRFTDTVSVKGELEYPKIVLDANIGKVNIPQFTD